jgi:hypothetical protein
LHQLTLRARARGIKIFGATIAPNGSSTVPGAFTPENEAKRQAVQSMDPHFRCIRRRRSISMPRCAIRRIPRAPAASLRCRWNPSQRAGYEAMANAVNLSMLF